MGDHYTAAQRRARPAATASVGLVLLASRGTVFQRGLIPGPALLLARPGAVDATGGRAQPHGREPPPGDGAGQGCRREHTLAEERLVLFSDVLIELRVLLQLLEVQHLVGVVEPVGLARPLGAVDQLDDHHGDVVAAVQLEAHPDQLRADLPQVCVGIALQPVPDKNRHAVALHDVPEAVAGQDADAPGLQPGHLVDVGDAGDLLITGFAVRIALVLEVAQPSAHREVAVEARRLFVGDEAAGGLDPRLLRGEVGLVVDALRDQGEPQHGRRGSPAAGEVWRHANREGFRLRLLLLRVPDDEAARVAAVDELQAVRAVVLLRYQSADNRAAGVLLRIVGHVRPEVGVDLREDGLHVRVRGQLATLGPGAHLLCELRSAVVRCAIASVSVQDPEAAMLAVTRHGVRVLVIVSPSLHLGDGASERRVAVSLHAHQLHGR
mmetsp:Transcript_74071/g.191076  ORF Transcript_74071/g.191076 Transcript_74071/m.191076 type:complete len:437 (+) Transcript_74071:35-1345(+)